MQGSLSSSSAWGSMSEGTSTSLLKGGSSSSKVLSLLNGSSLLAGITSSSPEVLLLLQHDMQMTDNRCPALLSPRLMACFILKQAEDLPVLLDTGTVGVLVLLDLGAVDMDLGAVDLDRDGAGSLVLERDLGPVGLGDPEAALFGRAGWPFRLDFGCFPLVTITKQRDCDYFHRVVMSAGGDWYCTLGRTLYVVFADFPLKNLADFPSQLWRIFQNI